MSEEKQETVKVKKAKKPVPLKEFLGLMYPMQVKKSDDEIEIIRPDMLGCKVEGLAPYGAYAKIIVDKKKEVLNVWTLVADKEEPDFRIVNGINFNEETK